MTCDEGWSADVAALPVCPPHRIKMLFPWRYNTHSSRKTSFRCEDRHAAVEGKQAEETGWGNWRRLHVWFYWRKDAAGTNFQMMHTSCWLQFQQKSNKFTFKQLCLLCENRCPHVKVSQRSDTPIYWSNVLWQVCTAKWDDWGTSASVFLRYDWRLVRSSSAIQWKSIIISHLSDFH